jgi:polysaccharide deacetylase 2 family uncharacterized protein YibQ
MKHFTFFAGLALAGIVGGYGVGHFFERSLNPANDVNPSAIAGVPQKPIAWYKKQQASSQIAQEPVAPIFQEPVPNARTQAEIAARDRTYEEGLPRDIYIAPDLSLYKEDLVLDTPESFFPAEESINPLPTNQSAGSERTGQTASTEIGSKKAPAGPLPAWRRYALASLPKKGVPAIAIVIDDMGVDRRRSARMINFPGPLTLSFLTYAKQLNNQGKRARANGHELMLHVAMEPGTNKVDPGPNVLLVRDKPEVTLKRLRWGLDQFNGFVGINNHMGSKFTSHAASMQIVIGELKRRGLLFLDSRTSGRTVGGKLARLAGVPYAERNVFLDHDDDVEQIKSQLKVVEKVARRRGSAVAIGHPRDATLKVLEEWLPTVIRKGFQLVPISALARIARQKV